MGIIKYTLGIKAHYYSLNIFKIKLDKTKNKPNPEGTSWRSAGVPFNTSAKVKYGEQHAGLSPCPLQ